MIGTNNVGGYGRVSISLMAAALLSLSAALGVVPRFYPSTIPERILDRVRGGNLSYWRGVAPQPNCTALNVYAANQLGDSYTTYYA